MHKVLSHTPLFLPVVLVALGGASGAACNGFTHVTDLKFDGTTDTPSCDNGAGGSCTSTHTCDSEGTTCQPHTYDEAQSACIKASPAASGTACSESGGSVCDGAGQCVTCVQKEQCADPTSLSPRCDLSTHTCISCSNGVQDSDERGVDCGGGCNAQCNGAACASGDTCHSAVCAIGQCKIEGAAACTEDEQCATRRCNAGVCSPCAADADCASGQCDTGRQICKAPARAPCEEDDDCITGKCNSGVKLCGLEVFAQCSSSSDCLTGVCKNGQCSTCSADADCGTGGVCNNGICALAPHALCNPSAPTSACSATTACAGFPATCH
ncbi:MAG: hypothetical protein QM820_20435 [Minicystis sp.]